MTFADERYPEATKLSAAHDARSAVADFLEWCEGQGFVIAAYAPEVSRHPVVLPETHEMLIMRFLGIDAGALERERREMLKELRDA